MGWRLPTRVHGIPKPSSRANIKTKEIQNIDRQIMRVFSYFEWLLDTQRGLGFGLLPLGENQHYLDQWGEAD